MYEISVGLPPQTVIVLSQEFIKLMIPVRVVVLLF